jgi:predicted RNA-binding Zn-ribbon protein involved in translation (DUF1610 family)
MAKRVSNVKDGFALKRQRKNTKPGKKRKVKGECTIPPPPVKHILSSYTMFNPMSKRAISDYVETQAHDEKVQHAERIVSEHVVGNDYDCWDVHTDKDRYWVITNPTNLYSQHYFPSLDYTLSFHIGVMLRVMALQRGAPSPGHKSRFTPIWRRWEQAAESYDTAEEAEDFQTVGMKCRETLIQFVRALAKLEMVPEGEEAPKRADVVGWSSLIANTIAPGDRNSYVRGHLKAISKSAWDLANWLTHANGATRPDAEIVIDAAQSVIGTFGTAVMRHESGSPERCPECGSYSIDVGFEPELMPRPYILECENCGWQEQQEEA